MLGRLTAFARGESTILDDKGQAAALYDSTKGEQRPKLRESMKLPVRDAGHKAGWSIKRLARVVFVGVSTLVPLCFVVFYAWMFSGWVGHKLLGLSGVLAYLFGGAMLIGAIVCFSLIALRWENAARSTRTKRGKRTIGDHLAICTLTIDHRVCAACKFSIADLVADDEGFVICPECGAAWNTDWWTDFLIREHLDPIEMRLGQRTMYCQLDARKQAFEVMQWVPRKQRRASVGRWWAGLRLSDWTSIALGLHVLAFIIWIVYRNAPMFLRPGVFMFIGATVLALIALVVLLQLRRRSITYRFQRFVRTQIDKRRCPHCDHELGEDRHPVDDAIMCPGCWHAWDPDTRARSHHARQTLKTEDFSRHPAFLKSS
jgi:uncharacterized Zn ribbon protein